MGTIQQLERDKPKSRCTRWRLWVSDSGVRRSKRFSGSYTQAVKELRRLEAESPQDAPERPQAPTFAEYAAQWLEYREASGAFKPNTITRLRSHVRILCRTRLGALRLCDVTPQDARETVIELQRTRKASSVSIILQTMALIFDQATADGLIERSPCDKLPSPKPAESERRALSPDEINATLDALDSMPLDGYTVAVRLMLCLGLRRGEALGVLREDIDGGVLHVRHALTGATNELGTPKSAAGVRDLPTPERLRATLEQWCDLMCFAASERIAVTAAGKPISAHDMREWWLQNRDALGCGGMVLHELRHSNLSLMARFMPSPFDLQHWAGWSSLAMTRRYVHKDQNAVASAVAAAFDAPKTHH